MLASTEALITKFVILGVSLLTSFIVALRFNTSLSLLKSTRTGTNLWTSNLSTLFLKQIKPVGIFSDLSIPNWSTSDFQLAKSTFSKNFDASTPVLIF